MKSLNEIRKEHGLPPLPPRCRTYKGWILMKGFTETKIILKSNTLSGDLMRLEIDWRRIKRIFRPYIKPILNYLK